MKNALILFFSLCAFIAKSQICGFNPVPNPNPTCSDPGTCPILGEEFYIPDENDEILTVNLRFWIMQDPLDLSANFQDIPAHRNYLENSIISNIHSRIYAAAGKEEQCDYNTTPEPNSVDTKIRFNLKEILFRKEDYTAHINAGSVCDLYCFENYIQGTEYEDDLNVFFCEIPGDNFGGCGMAYSNENENAVVLNNGLARLGTVKESDNLGHELGHCMGLLHRDASQGPNCFDFSCNNPAQFTGGYNQMMGLSGSQTYINPIEAAHMRRFLLTTWRSKWLTNPPTIKDVITINTPTVWDEDANWYGNIEIEAGGVLEVSNSTLLMGKDSRIYVKRGGKLIVDDATISSCVYNWGGIIVEGACRAKDANNPNEVLGQLDNPFNTPQALHAGTVIVHNGSIIENAKNAISTNAHHIGWPLVKYYWGGLIYTDDATFQNNQRSVEIFSNPDGDKSAFNNTTFIDGYDGVTIWDSDGVTFDNCTFENMENACIGPYNAELEIYGNTFRNSKFGIDLNSSLSSNNHTIIGDLGNTSNLFENMDHAVQLTSVNNLSHVEIGDNNIINGGIGILAIGSSNFDIHNNSFDGQRYGVIVRDIGNTTCFSQENYHRNRNFGYYNQFDNSRFSMLNNCFDTLTFGNYDFDIKLVEASIRENQGSNFQAAGNNFSDVTSDFISENSEFFTYHILQNNPPPETIPTNLPVAQVSQDAFQMLDKNCGHDNPYVPPGPGECEIGESEAEILSRIDTLEAEIIQLELSPNTFETNAQIADKKSCLERNLYAYARLKYAEKDVDALAAYFSNRPEFKMRTIGYSALVEFEKLTIAENYLLTINPNSQEESDYVFAQEFYLDYLTNMTTFELSETDKMSLYTKGLDQGPMRGYVRAIYYFLTGERIPVELPIADQRFELEEKMNSSIEGMLKIFPNPVSDNKLYLSAADENIIEAQLFTTQGVLIKKQSINNREGTFDLLGINSGIYFLSVRLKSDKIITEKIILID